MVRSDLILGAILLIIWAPVFGRGDDQTPFIPASRANADANVVCGTRAAMATFSKCVSQSANFDRLVKECGGFKLGFITLSQGTPKAVCSNAPKTINCIDTKYPLNQPDDYQQALTFHSCIGAPITREKLDGFKTSRDAHANIIVIPANKT